MTLRHLFHLFLRWVGGLLLLFLFALTWAYWHDQAGSGAPMGETITTDEDYLTGRIISAAIDTAVQSRGEIIHDAQAGETPAPTSEKTNPGYSPYHFTRDAHPKGHGCLLASFNVNKEIDSRFAYGIFAKGGDQKSQYDAMIRFSSGNPKIKPDSKWNFKEWDVQGMAIKLFNVPGDKLLPGDEGGTTQDFILMNNPVFFIRTIGEYAQFNSMIAANITNPYAYFLHGLNPMYWHVREFILGLRAQKPRPDSLMTTQFYSGSAYYLGPRQFVKYSAIPCNANHVMDITAPAGVSDDDANADYLRLELAKQSEAGGGCFDFGVQAQVQGKNMPVEDTTVKWKESDSPFVPLARIVVKPLKNNTAEMNEQCENTAFNPWHALVDHKPAGVMNRVRKSLYLAMSRFRQTKNCGASQDASEQGCDASRCNPEHLADSACAVPSPALSPTPVPAAQ